VIAAAAAPATAAIPVGSGGSHAGVYVEFADGAVYNFDVAYDGSTTGMGLLDLIQAAQPFTTVRVFGGMFLDGITYAGHSNIGWGGGENWWHYWTREGSGPWSSPESYGAFDRVVQNGSADGWIYGRAGAPVPEPGGLGLMGLGVFMLCRRSSRRPRQGA
jgi:hypothetical protein